MFTASALRHVRAFATQASPPSRKLLRPYDLAQQLKRLTSDGDLDAAVHRLRSVPRDAQNVPAWNTMLSLCMSHKKFQLAYTLFIDVSSFHQSRQSCSPNCADETSWFLSKRFHPCHHAQGPLPDLRLVQPPQTAR